MTLFADQTDRDKQQLREVLELAKPASELALTPTPTALGLAPVLGLAEIVHTPTRDELADLFRPSPRQPTRIEPTRERDRRVAALTRAYKLAKVDTTHAQRSARFWTHCAKDEPVYEEVAREARTRALNLVRYRGALREQLTTLVNPTKQEATP